MWAVVNWSTVQSWWNDFRNRGGATPTNDDDPDDDPIPPAKEAAVEGAVPDDTPADDPEDGAGDPADLKASE